METSSSAVCPLYLLTMCSARNKIDGDEYNKKLKSRGQKSMNGMNNEMLGDLNMRKLST